MGIDRPGEAAARAEVVAILGYTLEPEEQAPFEAMHAYINRSKKMPQRRSLAPADGERYDTFVHCAYAYPSRAYRAACHHRDTLRGLEERLHELGIARELDLGLFGNTVRYDAAYHSFLFSARACLDYLAVGLGAFFDVRDKKGRGPENLTDLLQKAHLATIPIPRDLMAIVEEPATRFPYLFSAQAARNKAAHLEFLKPLHVGVGRQGIRLIDRFEKLAPGVRLSDELTGRLGDLHHFLAQVFAELCVLEWRSAHALPE